MANRRWWKAQGYTTPAYWTMIPNSGGVALLVIKREHGWYAADGHGPFATREEAFLARHRPGQYRGKPGGGIRLYEARSKSLSSEVRRRREQARRQRRRADGTFK